MTSDIQAFGSAPTRGTMPSGSPPPAVFILRMALHQLLLGCASARYVIVAHVAELALKFWHLESYMILRATHSCVCLWFDWKPKYKKKNTELHHSGRHHRLRGRRRRLRAAEGSRLFHGGETDGYSCVHGLRQEVFQSEPWSHAPLSYTTQDNAPT